MARKPPREKVYSMADPHPRMLKVFDETVAKANAEVERRRGEAATTLDFEQQMKRAYREMRGLFGSKDTSAGEDSSRGTTEVDVLRRRAADLITRLKDLEKSITPSRMARMTKEPGSHSLMPGFTIEQTTIDVKRPDPSFAMITIPVGESRSAGGTGWLLTGVPRDAFERAKRYIDRLDAAMVAADDDPVFQRDRLTEMVRMGGKYIALGAVRRSPAHAQMLALQWFHNTLLYVATLATESLFIMLAKAEDEFIAAVKASARRGRPRKGEKKGDAKSSEKALLVLLGKVGLGVETKGALRKARSRIKG